MQLLSILPSVKLHDRQKEIIVAQIVDNIEAYGKPEIIAENLSYFIHCIRTIPGYGTDWKHQNQLMLAFHKLATGLTITLNQEKMARGIEEEEESKEETSSCVSELPVINLHNATEIEKRSTPLDRAKGLHQSKSISCLKSFVDETITSKIHKADTVISRREQRNNRRKISDVSITRKGIQDKDKMIYKRIMLENKVGHDPDSPNNYSFHKRTLKDDPKDPDYEYKIRPIVYCHGCRKNLPLDHIPDSMPLSGEKIRIKEKVDNEKHNLAKCKECGNNKVSVTLCVTRARVFISKYKKKYEKVGEFRYYGPFLLFSKLKKFQKNELTKTLSMNKQVSTTSLRINGLLQELTHSSGRLMQFDIMRLFYEHKDLFWNLIYRFTKDGRDYVFLLPYEVDIEEGSEDEVSTPSSSGLLSPRSMAKSIDSRQSPIGFGKINSLGNKNTLFSEKLVPQLQKVEHKGSNFEDYSKQYTTRDHPKDRKLLPKLDTKDSRKSF